MARAHVENDSSDQAADVDALIAALASADANVRLDAVADLGLVKDARTEALLAITALQDPQPSVRAEALYSLGALRAESQLAAIQLAITDPDPDVRKAASGALEDLGDASKPPDHAERGQ
jgi:HEAT repeat protein